VRILWRTASCDLTCGDL